MARRDPVGIRLITRKGNDWTNRYPLVGEAVNHLTCPLTIGQPGDGDPPIGPAPSLNLGLVPAWQR